MVVHESLALETPHGSLPVETFRATTEKQLPAVIVIHDIFGMSRDVRQQATWLADSGFLAVVPDFFSEGNRIVCIQRAMRDLRANSGRLFDQIEAVRGMVRERPDCTGRIGVIGFCFGGSFALLLAPREGYGAVSANYGMLPKQAATFFTGSCPVIATYGKRDRSLRGAASTLDTILTSAEVPHTVIEYPEAGHGFLNDHDRGDHPLIFAVFGTLLHAGYHAPSAADARPRILAFLHDALDTHGPEPSTRT